MNENGKISGLYSWPVIILALCIFWPVGLFLIFKRFSVDKRAAVGAGIGGLNIVGYCLAIFGALGFLVEITNEGGSSSDGLMLAFFLIAGGVALILRAKKIKKEAEGLKQYISIIVNGNVRGLDAIAATTGKSYDVVKNDIQKMINKGYLKNAYISEGTREVVLPESNANTNYDASQNVVSASVTTRVVTCPCCGANNTIAGDIGECEYCGSPLK